MDCRPYNYGRALQFDSSCCDGEVLAQGRPHRNSPGRANDTNSSNSGGGKKEKEKEKETDASEPSTHFRRLVCPALEAKGVGVGPTHCNSTDDSVDSVDVTSEYASGTISLVETLRGFATYQVLKVIGGGGPGLRYGAAPTYAAIDAGFKIPKFGEPKDTTR